MGVGVSGWRLARAVSREGQLGVVSGTALAVVLARRLQLGDAGGHLRRALSHFPFPGVAQQALEQWFVPGGKGDAEPFRLQPMPGQDLGTALTYLTVLANFAEVFLAREEHGGIVGINYLEKVQTPALASLYGAMLAGVDYVLMGAGIPRAIPGILDQLAAGQAVRLKLDVAGLPAGQAVYSEFDPQVYFGAEANKVAQGLKRPRFLAIVSSATLAATLARKASGPIEGFVIEGPSAGGHNAPPRGAMVCDDQGEPIYGERDLPDLARFRELGLPFWLAGSFADAGRLAEAQTLGAAGIQVGTAFAFCDESGLDAEIKRRVIQQVLSGEANVRTDLQASPTGFPFKVLQMEGTLSQKTLYERRLRSCDMGYLRSACADGDGQVAYRCPAEPVAAYIKKGGKLEETVGRKCLCNALLAAIGLAQMQADGMLERSLLTAGSSVRSIRRFLSGSSYTAAEVIRRLLAPPVSA